MIPVETDDILQEELNEARNNVVRNFAKHPECMDSERKVRALILDSMPELKAQKNILFFLYKEGFVDKIRYGGSYLETASRYRHILTDDCGYSQDVSVWCIETWILILSDALGILEKRADTLKDALDDIDVPHAVVLVKGAYERLLEEIKNLKALIIALTTERDDLKYHICKDLEVEYNNRIGELEVQVLIAKLHVLELKRTIDIYQSFINRQEKKSVKTAEKQAKKEYEKFAEDLKKKAEEAKKANKYKQDKDEQEKEWEKEQEERDGDRKKRYKSRTDEMKAIYRKIVKALHPDMNPDQTEEEKELFKEAVEAYDESDLSRLREIEAMLDEGKLDITGDDKEKDIEHLKEIIEGLKLRVDSLQEEIEAIKGSFPYVLKDFLDDEEAVAERQKELADLLNEYDKQAKELEERLEKMKSESGKK